MPASVPVNVPAVFHEDCADFLSVFCCDDPFETLPRWLIEGAPKPLAIQGAPACGKGMLAMAIEQIFPPEDGVPKVYTMTRPPSGSRVADRTVLLASRSASDWLSERGGRAYTEGWVTKRVEGKPAPGNLVEHLRWMIEHPAAAGLPDVGVTP